MKTITIIGAGPAGLIAAETLAEKGFTVEIYDRMPSPGRKFLIAGKGGLNLTHSEPFESFLSRYGEREKDLTPHLTHFGPTQIRSWAQKYGTETFVGTSGRVFPVGMKAAPLLFAWKNHLSAIGVKFHFRHQWQGFKEDRLVFSSPHGEVLSTSNAAIFALGGASWPSTGSTGDWVGIFEDKGIKVQPLKPSNCGFKVLWSETFKAKYDGSPLKSITIETTDSDGRSIKKQGEFITTKDGVEGSLIYALSATLRKTIEATGSAFIKIDLLPDLSQTEITNRISTGRGKRSLSSFLEKKLGLGGVKLGLFWEFTKKSQMDLPETMASALKNIVVPLISPHSVEESISSAGGIAFEEMDENMMLKKIPGIFCAGEMLDWEAPTGGYLLTASFATGIAAANGVAKWLAGQ